MRKDQERYIRDARAALARAIQRAISLTTPFLEADEQGRRWSNVDRFDACEAVEDLGTAVVDVARALREMPDVDELKPAVRARYVKLVGTKKQPGGALNVAAAIASKVTPAAMQTADARHEADAKAAKAGTLPAGDQVHPSGQRYYVLMYRQLMQWLRRALGAMFFLTDDAPVRVIRLTERQTSAYLDPLKRDEVVAVLRRKANELARNSKVFVEVEFTDPRDGETYVIHDAGPLEAKIQVIELPKDVAEEYFNPRLRHIAEAKLKDIEKQARREAEQMGASVEVEAVHPVTGERHVVYEAGPHVGAERREIALARREELRAWPYVANAAVDEHVLLALYEIF